MDRAAKIKKYRINTAKFASHTVDWGYSSSPREIIQVLSEGIEKFKEKYGTEDCSVDIEDGSARFSNYIKKSDEEIDVEIAAEEAKRNEKDYQTFLTLKARYES
jgi:hypothetical protein